MKTIAVIRKPLESTVANNVLKHGCGGLNIDACRISYEEGYVPPKDANIDKPSSWTSEEYNGDKPYILNAKLKTRQDYTPSGRYPANLILNEAAAESLDEQTEVSISTGGTAKAGQFASLYGTFSGENPGSSAGGYGDAGGASRYFKNVKEDLVSYLRDLITPPEGVVKVVPLDIIEPTGEDGSVHGFIVMGTPTSDQCEELLRICKPGAHVLLIAPEDQPTGHTGMCRMEDAGFEIRDAILLLLEAGGFWYIPKPSRFERDAGCHKLRVPGYEAVNRKEGSKGLESPRAGAGRTANKVGNSHPTVKPFAIMQVLMEGQEGPVVDPFMGSGSTGIAAVHTGHDFIGIEREEDYLKIADARIHHWSDNEWRGRITEVVSDLEQEPETEPEVMDLGSLFGLGGSK